MSFLPSQERRRTTADYELLEAEPLEKYHDDCKEEDEVHVDMSMDSLDPAVHDRHSGDDLPPSPDRYSSPGTRMSIKLVLSIFILLLIMVAVRFTHSSDLLKRFRKTKTYLIPNEATLITRPPLQPLEHSKIDIVTVPANRMFAGWVLSDDSSRLPPCERIYVFNAMSNSGFASVYNSLVRGAAIAAQLNYTFLIESGRWQYGAWTNYFEPTRIDCVPPVDWARRELATTTSSPGWQNSSRVHQTTSMEAYVMKNWAGSLKDALKDLYATEFGEKDRHVGILPADENLPEALVPAFEAQYAAARQLWKPNQAILDDVEQTKLAMGIGNGRPSIGVHVRLGDKKHEFQGMLELSNVQQTFGNLSVFLEVAHQAYKQMLMNMNGKNVPLYSPTEPSRILQYNSTLPRPKIVVMTAEEGLLMKLSSDPLGAPFEFERTPSLRLPEGRFTQKEFRTLPIDIIVAHTRQLIRDITLLAHETDAAVISGSSNVGRLVMLLAGIDAVAVKTTPEGDTILPMVRSVDIWWHPTAHARAVWEAIKVYLTPHFAPDHKIKLIPDRV